jgi:hypothetical protein
VFSIHVEVDGLVRKLDTCAETAHQLTPALESFGKYWFKKTKDRYAAQDFAPLAESTLEKRAQRGVRTMGRKLRADVAKADKRARAASGDRRGVVAKLLGSADMTAASLGLTRGQQNRLAVLAEFQKRHGAGRGERVVGKTLSLKQGQSLTNRTARAVARSVGGPILGGLPRTLFVEEDVDSVTLTSRTRHGFSDVHNQGGTAGHGAHEPKRETLKADQTDLEVLTSILKSHLLQPFDGKQGPGF